MKLGYILNLLILIMMIYNVFFDIIDNNISAALGWSTAIINFTGILFVKKFFINEDNITQKGDGTYNEKRCN